MTDDDALIKAMALAMFEYGLATREERAKAALAVARPIIEAPLRADNAKLRAALKPFADKIDYCTGTKDSDYMDAVFQLGEVRAAAAALKETQHD